MSAMLAAKAGADPIFRDATAVRMPITTAASPHHESIAWNVLTLATVMLTLSSAGTIVAA